MQTTETIFRKSKKLVMTKSCLPTATNLSKNDEYNMQNKQSYFITTKNQFIEYGECPPLPDEEFYKLMITDSKGQINPKMVEITLKYFPELSKFTKYNNADYLSTQSLYR